MNRQEFRTPPDSGSERPGSGGREPSGNRPTSRSLATTATGAVFGVDGLVVRVEVDLSTASVPRTFRTVGLPDAAVREAQQRVRAALRNCGFSLPDANITVNLAPAGVRKQGAGFDLAVAVGIAAAAGESSRERLGEALLLGELALSGAVRPVRGVLPIAFQAAAEGLRMALVAPENAAEAALVPDLAVYPVASLRSAVDLLGAASLPDPAPPPPPWSGAARRRGFDLADVRGQLRARRALEIAAAGGHNLLFVGPPGGGKTLLAGILPDLLPPLTRSEALEVAKIRSALGGSGVLRSDPPFRAPHHTISYAGMAGGGRNPRPGELTLAHRGVLFLDELPEFQRPVLECLRQPIESGEVRLRRASGHARFPARFQLVAAMNPCPCGYEGTDGRPCRCPPGAVARYRSRVSGPLLDRMDIRLPVRPVRAGEMLGRRPGESTAVVRERVLKARERRAARENGAEAERDPDRLPDELVRWAMEGLGMSARGVTRARRVAGTIADLEGAGEVEPRHFREALQFRAVPPGGVPGQNPP